MNPEASNSLMEEKKKGLIFCNIYPKKKSRGVNKGEKVNVSCNSSFILQNKVDKFPFVEEAQDHAENNS